MLVLRKQLLLGSDPRPGNDKVFLEGEPVMFGPKVCGILRSLPLRDAVLLLLVRCVWYVSRDNTAQVMIAR